MAAVPALRLRGMPQPRPRLVYGLFCVFGISSWITVNGVFAQLPLLAERQPEGEPSPTPAPLSLSWPR